MKNEITVYYDGECPFCHRYVDFLQLKQHYTLSLKDARGHLEEIQHHCKGMDINEGLIVITHANKSLQGAAALKYLDGCLSKSRFIDKLHAFWSLHPAVTLTLYRIIKSVRTLLLYLMGRDPRIK